jgi:hypothetical protein
VVEHCVHDLRGCLCRPRPASSPAFRQLLALLGWQSPDDLPCDPFAQGQLCGGSRGFSSPPECGRLREVFAFGGHYGQFLSVVVVVV